MQTKRHPRGAERIKSPLLEVIRDFFIEPQFLDRPQLVVVFAESAGQHVVPLAAQLPHVDFQPVAVDSEVLSRMTAEVGEAKSKNVRSPLLVESSSDVWPVEEADFVLCVDMIHRWPWSTTEALFRGAGRILPSDGFLILYGPCRFSGAFKASNTKQLDATLRAKNPEWGVRDEDDLDQLGESLGFDGEDTIALPGDNHCLVFHKGCLDD